MSTPVAEMVTDEVVETFHRDGAVWIPGALSPAWLQLIELGVRRNLLNPGPHGYMQYEGEPGAYWQDFINWGTVPEYRRLLADSPIVEIMAKVLRTEELWFYFDQIFVKEGGESRRTNWHQDSPYWLADGPKMASMWISLDPLAEDETLEVVAGSHRHPHYRHPANTGNQDTVFRGDDTRPPLPDIESERDKWPIITHASQPGDVLILHPTALHGGAAMREGGRRRTLSLRFFGDGTRHVQWLVNAAPPFPGVSEALKPGDPLIHPYFPKVWPRGSAL